LQLWALGRAATAETLSAEGGYQVVSASDIPRLSGSDIPLDHERDTEGKDRPRLLTVEEIKEYVGFYAQAAKNFVIGAGGDGVEVHGANG
jgi:NADPH2 dehydrogenase